MKPSEALRKHRQEVLEIIASHSVTNPRVFGSVSRGEDTEESDLDILVDATYDINYVDLFLLQEDLADTLGVSVDILTPGELRPRIRERVLSEALAL
jgi:predicted nucleotidyltransferase